MAALSPNVLNQLSKEALNSELLMRHAAMIHRSGKKQTTILGHNHYMTSPYSKDNISVHAEQAVITRFINSMRKYTNANDAKIRRKLNKITMIIIKLNTNVQSIDKIDCTCLKLSDPCIECLTALKKYGIKKIIVSQNYENDDDINICMKKINTITSGILSSGSRYKKSQKNLSHKIEN